MIKLVARTTLLILIGVMGSTHCERMKSTSVKFNRIDSTFNPKNLEFFNMFITPGSEGHSFEMDSRLIVNVSSEVYVGVSLMVRSLAKEAYKVIFAYDFDVCRIWGSRVWGQTIARLWFKNLKKYSNLPTSCPLWEGRYYVRRMRIDTRSVPMFVMSGEYIVNSSMYIKRGAIKDLISNATLEVEILKR